LANNLNGVGDANYPALFLPFISIDTTIGSFCHDQSTLPDCGSMEGLVSVLVVNNHSTIFIDKAVRGRDWSLRPSHGQHLLHSPT